MKKWISCVLVMLLALGTFGCSPAELGYLAMSKESASLPGATFDSKMALNFDKQLAVGTPLEKLNGHVELQIEGKMDQSTMAIDYNIGYRLNDKQAFKPMLHMVMVDNKIYYSTQDIFAVLGEFEPMFKGSPEFAKEMGDYLKANPYMVLDLTAEGQIDQMALSKDIVDMTLGYFDVLTNNHEGYTTGLVSEKDGGYMVELTVNGLVDAVSNWFTYAKSHPDNAYNVYHEFARLMNKLSGEVSYIYSQEEVASNINELATDWSELAAEIKKIPIDKEDGYQSFVKVEGEKGSRQYIGEEKLVVKEFGIELTSTSISKEAQVTIEPVAKATDLELLVVGVEQIVDKYTAYKNTTITFDSSANVANTNDQYMTARANVNMDFCGSIMPSTSWINVVNIDGASHVNAYDMDRLLYDNMLGYDEATAEYYLMNGEEKVILNATEVDGESYIQLRELTKAGYGVTWTKAPVSTIVITPAEQMKLNAEI